MIFLALIGAVVAVGFSAIITLLLAEALRDAIEATWFVFRCKREGAFIKPGIGVMLRIWRGAWAGKIKAATGHDKSGDYTIPYPGWPWQK